jgi:enterochelin esterase family protein
MSQSRSLLVLASFLGACGGSNVLPDGGPTPTQDAQQQPQTDSGPVPVDGDGTFLIGPGFTDAPEYTPPADAPEGLADNFEFMSNEGTHFMTDVTTGAPFTRTVIVWVPSQYVPGTAAPFMVLQDGYDYFDTVTIALRTLIHQRRVPPMIVIAVSAGDGGATGERNLEYDTMSDEYTRFIEDDILPRVRERYSVTLTSDPDGRASFGGSSGGAAALTMGWFRPDLYRRIFTVSGSFVNRHPDAMYARGAWEYHASLIPSTEPKPLRIFLECGTADFDWNEMEGDQFHNWLQANQAMAQVLAARGYHYRYVEAAGAEHVDNAAMRQYVPEALVWLWRGYPIP